MGQTGNKVKNNLYCRNQTIIRIEKRETRNEKSMFSKNFKFRFKFEQLIVCQSGALRLNLAYSSLTKTEIRKKVRRDTKRHERVCVRERERKSEIEREKERE